MLLGAIADDLTGATDLALMLAREGMRTIQTIGAPPAGATFGDADAVVVALKSRTILSRDAVESRLPRTIRCSLRGAEQVLFKYCSTFDSTNQGNIGPVIDALMRELDVNRTIACPAFPDNGRTIYKGYLFVGDVLLSESGMKDHPLTPMRDANLMRVLQRQTARRVGLIQFADVSKGAAHLTSRLQAGDAEVFIVDALNNADLRVIGEACANMRLITGGSGIAMGQPDNFRRKGKLPARAKPLRIRGGDGKSVSLAGSCSAATRRQIAWAIVHGVPACQMDPLALASGKTNVDDLLNWVESQRDGVAPLVYATAEPEAVLAVQATLGRDEAGRLVETALADLAGRLSARGYTKFVVAGGETSGAVVEKLEARTLAIGQEIDPGVTWVETHEEPTLCLALKSGNFGAEDFFLKAWKVLERR